MENNNNISRIFILVTTFKSKVIAEPTAQFILTSSLKISELCQTQSFA